jgi:glycerol kinase
MASHILALDQGTTSTRAIVFDAQFNPVAAAQIELPQHFPQPGWVEHEPEDIWEATLEVMREAMAKVGGAGEIAAIGITNQRETTLVWDAATGKALHRAIVWQDRRTSEICAALKAAKHEARVQAETGLLIDPYFSGTKLRWILDHHKREGAGLRFGTVDSYLIARLTGGKVHATDPTNASRTLLFHLAQRRWDEGLCALFGAPMAMLPQVRASAGDFGATDPALFGRAIPITGVAGDQQAALVGHGCLSPGEAKATFGTGCFLVMNTGASPRASHNKLLATLGYEAEGKVAYALEGSIFSAGSTIQWLRDGLGLIGASKDSEASAASLKDNGGVYLVPAFAGLGAPQWAPNARGTIIGLTRDSTGAHLVRAGVEAVAYQTADLLEALAADGAPKLAALKVDGGVTGNAWAMQFLADICDCPVERPAFQEVTALGAAKLAALGVGAIPNLAAAAVGGDIRRWTPQMGPDERNRLKAGWAKAVKAALAAV